MVGDFKLSKTGFRAVPENLDTLLKGSVNIWFTEDRNLEVTVLVDASCSNYFRRRKMLPDQEIKEERPDGSLVVSCRVGQYEAIRGLLKSWIPHIIILAPEDFRMSLLKDMKQWIKRQEKE